VNVDDACWNARAWLPTFRRRRVPPPVAGRRGFTLIELIIVMTLLLIVVGVGFPSLRNFFKGRTLDSEARRFLTLTRYAQSRAVSEGVPMVLWVDVRERTYGLQAQAGYLDTDGKAVEYELEEDLQVEVSAPLVSSTTMSNQRTRTAAVAGNLPAIRFTPDGFIGETSPETVQFREGAERDSSALWITQAPNRLNYEISANPPATFRR
jgi:prepilin-type N-terminal cleavage/methylation domain-containing protein